LSQTHLVTLQLNNSWGPVTDFRVAYLGRAVFLPPTNWNLYVNCHYLPFLLVCRQYHTTNKSFDFMVQS
jgi:hypothetical protein